MNSEELLTSYLGEGNLDDKYTKLGLSYNPFPRSGTANINDNDRRSFQLMPVSQDVLRKVLTFITNSLTENPANPSDKFQSCVIQGDYGSGKTQLLLFIRGYLHEIGLNPQYKEVPYVIYIDKPGVSLLEFLGNVISKIGDENLRKYLWNDIIEKIKNNKNYRETLENYCSSQMSLFDSEEATNPFSNKNTVSYKKFLGTFTGQIGRMDRRKSFDKDFKNIITDILYESTKDAVIANYFYEFISSDYGVNKAWEELVRGTSKVLSNKEAGIIKYIVRLVKKEGFTDFFILVDEFEDITEGRLNKVQLDNYIYNLRTLLDEHREWALFFSMNPLAYKKLRSVSPPLADRISTSVVILNNLDPETATSLVKNYVAIGGGTDIGPFTYEAIERLSEMVDGNVRRFLTQCFCLVEEATRELSGSDQKIDVEFVEKKVSKDDI